MPGPANRSLSDRDRVSSTNEIARPEGWDVLKRIYKRIYLDLQEKNVSALATGVVFFAMTIGAIIVVIVLTLVAVMPAALALVPTRGRAEIIGAIIRLPMVVILLILGLAAVYRFAPCRREVKWHWMSWGSVVATILWIAASAAFSFYVGRFGRYDKTFGSLGAVVVLLTWLYLSAYAVFLGACLDADRTAKVKRRPQVVR